MYKDYKYIDDGAEWSHNRKVYAGMLTAADEGIGMIEQTLKDAGMWDNTVLIVTTDNGASSKHTGTGSYTEEFGDRKKKNPGSNFPLRGGKSEGT